MSVFALLIAMLAVAGLLAMVAVIGRGARSGSGTRSKQRAKREAAQLEADTTSRPGADASASDDAPRMPRGDLPPKP